jgi:NAD(P)-dependent dehydrogenase (short-subunit alcohol dehydrogenase family)
VETVMNKFGRVDVLVCNAGALWWKDVVVGAEEFSLGFFPFSL